MGYIYPITEYCSPLKDEGFIHNCHAKTAQVHADNANQLKTIYPPPSRQMPLTPGEKPGNDPDSDAYLCSKIKGIAHLPFWELLTSGTVMN
jgi:hypothetical protein